MKKTFGTIALLAAGVALALAPAPALAGCSGDVFFGQAPELGTYQYIISPGVRSTSTLQANFWAVGAGNPTNGVGIDNGTSSDDIWLPEYAGTFSLYGSWQNPLTGGQVDGCIDTLGTGSVMAVVISDVDATSGAAYFAVACATRNGSALREFTFNPGADITLKALPVTVGGKEVNVSGSVRTGNDSSITVASPDFSQIYYSDGSLGCAIGNVIEQYDVWIKKVDRNSPAPSARNSTAPDGVFNAAPAVWVLGNTCAVGGPCTVNTTCGTTNCDNYIAVSPRLDSAFQSGNAPGVARISGNSVRVQAGPVLANPPPRFKNLPKGPKKLN